MLNRRRTARAASNATGTLRVLDDVEIEHLTDRAITVLSETQVPRGERMIFWAQAEDGSGVPLRVRAVRRQAVLGSSLLRQRVRFDVDEFASTDLAGGVAQAASGAQHPARVGGVVREVPIRLIDIGAGGCSIESPVRIAEGAVGWLSVKSENVRYDEVVRVCRSDSRIERFWQWISGLEFLTLKPPTADSLRRNIARFTNSGVNL